jgi:hypothetical protein
MIPTLPSHDDIPKGPERPPPIKVPRPTANRLKSDDLEELKRAIVDLTRRIEGLERRIVQLETRR